MTAVLISSSGRRVELWRLFEAAIADLKLDWRVVGVDASDACATGLVTQGVSVVPRVTDPAFEEALQRVIAESAAEIIIPTIDTELPWYSCWVSGSARVVVSSRAAISITRDKLRTFEWAARHGIPVPATVPLADYALLRGDRFVLKPISGSSSVGLRLGVRRHEIGGLCELNDSSDLVVQEQLSGLEYTVNCYVRADGGCAYAIPHQRIAVRGGEVSRGITQYHSGVEALARQCVELLPGVRGPVCVQIIDDERRGPTLIEANLRFGGGYPLAHAAGARAPARILAEHLEMPIPDCDAWVDGIEMIRYDSSVFRKRS